MLTTVALLVMLGLVQVLVWKVIMMPFVMTAMLRMLSRHAPSVVNGGYCLWFGTAALLSCVPIHLIPAISYGDTSNIPFLLVSCIVGDIVAVVAGISVFRKVLRCTYNGDTWEWVPWLVPALVVINVVFLFITPSPSHPL